MTESKETPKKIEIIDFYRAGEGIKPFPAKDKALMLASGWKLATSRHSYNKKGKK